MDRSKEHIEAQLCAYIDGELTDAERVEIEQHLASNPHHRKLIQELRLASDALRSLPRARVPIELNEALTGQLERTALLDPTEDETGQAGVTINRWPQITAVAAVLMLAVGLGVVVYYVLPASTRSGSPMAVDDKGAKQNRLAIDGLAVTRPAQIYRSSTQATVADPLATKALRDGGADGAREASVPTPRPEPESENLVSRGASVGVGSQPGPMDGRGRGSAATPAESGVGTRTAGGAPAAPAISELSLQAQPPLGGGGGGGAGGGGGGFGREAFGGRGGVVTEKEVAEFRKRVLEFGEGNAAFDAKGEKNLYLVVSSPKAEVASSQVTAYFNSNGIQYLNAAGAGDAVAALADAAPKAARAERMDVAAATATPATSPAFKPTYSSEAAAGRGGAGTSKGGAAAGGSMPTVADALAEQLSKEDFSIAPQPARPPLGLDGVGRDKDRTGFADRSWTDGGGTESLARPTKPSSGADADAVTRGATTEALRPDSVKDDVRESNAKAVVKNPAAASPTTLAADGSSGARAPEAQFRGVGQVAQAYGVTESGRGRMILARMNRRQVAELKDVLTKEAGQVAEVVEGVAPIALGVEDGKADRLRYGVAAADSPAGAAGAENRTSGTFAGGGIERAGGPEAAAGRRMMERDVARPAPASRPAGAVDQVYQWNAPSTLAATTTPAPVRGAADELRLNAGVLDEPVDVVIVVRDASVVIPEAVAPTTPGGAPAKAGKQ